MTAAEARFDPLIHSPHRLQVCAVLDALSDVEFAVLRERLDVSESVLSKQIKALEDAGYLKVSKSTRESRVRGRASFTKAGRAAYRSHVAALREIVG